MIRLSKASRFTPLFVLALAGSDLDIWGVQEVVEVPHFDNLISQLSGYDGFLANDPSVTDGAAYYSDFDGTEQKVGIIYKTSVLLPRHDRSPSGDE